MIQPARRLIPLQDFDHEKAGCLIIEAPENPYAGAKRIAIALVCVFFGLIAGGIVYLAFWPSPPLPAQSPLPDWIPQITAKPLEKLLKEAKPRNYRWQAGHVYGQYRILEKREQGCYLVLLTREDQGRDLRAELVRCPK